MGRDTVQLETAVNTTSHEYLLEFTSEYDIPEKLHPVLPGPKDRIVDFPEDMDMFNLIRAPNPTKVKVRSHPRAPYEVPLLTLTAPRVIEMDKPAATNSSDVPSTIERSPLDFAHEAGASDQGAAAPEIPSSEDVPTIVASGVGQAEKTATMDPPTAPESRSSRRGKSIAAIQLGLASTVVPEDAPVGVSDPDPLSFADAPSRHPADVAQSSQGIAAAGDPGSENASSPAEVGSPGSGSPGPKNPSPGAGNKKSGSTTGDRGRNKEGRGRQECWADQRIRRPSCPVLRCPSGQRIFISAGCYSPGAAIVGRRWVIGHGLRLAMIKCAESLEMRQAFADVVSARVAKGMSEGLKHRVEHGQAQLKVESIEAYDPEAETKFVAALQSLKDLKYPLLDQLEGLKDAPMDVIIAALYLESDTGGDAPQYIRDLRPSSSQLTIPMYPKVPDPRNT
nr:transposase (putative), gypsy type [Tanacetum cinerariifolium]